MHLSIFFTIIQQALQCSSSECATEITTDKGLFLRISPHQKLWNPPHRKLYRPCVRSSLFYLACFPLIAVKFTQDDAVAMIVGLNRLLEIRESCVSEHIN